MPDSKFRTNDTQTQVLRNYFETKTSVPSSPARATEKLHSTSQPPNARKKPWSDDDVRQKKHDQQLAKQREESTASSASTTQQVLTQHHQEQMMQRNAKALRAQKESEIAYRSTRQAVDMSDVFQTSGGKLAGVLDGIYHVATPLTQMVNSAFSSIPFAIGGILHAIQIIRKPAAQQRKLKIAYGFFGVALPSLGAVACIILINLGVAAAAFVLPVLITLIASTFFAKFLRKFWRARKGLSTEGLLEQKTLKLQLALDKKDETRQQRFALEVLALSIKYNQFEINSPSQKSDEDVLQLIQEEFNNDPTRFIDWLNNERSAEKPEGENKADYRQWAKSKCELLKKHQENKYETQKKIFVAASFFAFAALLSALAIALGAFSVVAPAIIVAIGLVAGGVSTLSVLGFGSVLIASNYRDYRNAMETYKNDPVKQSQLRFGAGFQIAGTAILAISGAFLGITAAMASLVSPAIIIGVGAALLVMGMTMVFVGARKLALAKQALADLPAEPGAAGIRIRAHHERLRADSNAASQSAQAVFASGPAQRVRSATETQSDQPKLRNRQ